MQLRPRVITIYNTLSLKIELMTKAMLVILVCVMLSPGSSLEGSIFNLSVPHDPIPVQLDSSVILHCQINPALNAAPLHVHWYRNNEAETTVLYYENQQILETSGDPQYRGRASLVGDLEKGDVSMKLENLTVADRGGYICFVKSDTWYETASLSLKMKVVGSPPVLSYSEEGKDKVSVSCVSEGWSYEPTLIWRDRKGGEITDISDHEYSTDADGLVSVRSWLLVSPSKTEWISCSVYLSIQERRESRILPQITRAETDSISNSTGAWQAAFIAILVLVFLGLALIFLSHRKGYITIGKQPVTGKRPSCIGTEETSPLKMPTAEKDTETVTSKSLQRNMDHKSTMSDAQIIKIPDLDAIKGNAVQLTLDPAMGPSFQRVGNQGKSVKCVDPQKQAAHGDQHPHVLCKERLSSHQHYWEVSGYDASFKLFGSQPLYDRQSWYVGVCTAAAAAATEQALAATSPPPEVASPSNQQKPTSKGQTPLTPQNGFWILHYQKENGYFANTEPPTPVPEAKDIKKLGVYLDCDKHTLSFYNADDKTHLCMFYNIPPLKTLVPLICPGVKHNDYMYIMQPN